MNFLDLFNLHWWQQVWWGSDEYYPAEVIVSKNDDLYPASGTRGTLVIGDSGVGKTRYITNQIFKRWRDDPHLTVFSFDMQGGFTKVWLDLMSREANYEKLMERTKLDELGNEERVMAKPAFSPLYGLTPEEQVGRLVENMQKFSEFMSKTAPFLVGVSVREIGKHLFRLLQVIRNDYGESWQLTEGLDLIIDIGDEEKPGKLRKALKEFGGYVTPTKLYFEKQFIPKDVMPPHEKELATRALRFLLGMIDSQVVRATLGFYKPSWTPKEATEKGQVILVDAHVMKNQKEAQHFLVVEAFSQVMAWLNKREPDDPKNHRVIILIDEAKPLLAVEGFVEWLSDISVLYRAKGIELVVLIQGLWQLEKEYRDQIWSMGTVISFRRDDNKDATVIAKQFWNYDNHYVKNPALTDTQNPTTESPEGQDRMAADWIQNLDPRSFVMRLYISEQHKERVPVFIKKTTELTDTKQYITVPEMKQRLIGQGIPIRESLEVIKAREKDLPPTLTNDHYNKRTPPRKKE